MVMPETTIRLKKVNYIVHCNNILLLSFHLIKTLLLIDNDSSGF